MKVSILIPHWRTHHITAYSVWKLLENVGKHDVEIIVINNSVGHDSINSLLPFKDEIKIIDFETKGISSHGIALDYGMNFVSNEIVITGESDSFPTQPDWIDYYEELIKEGYDSAGSLLQLSGGSYVHGAGAFFKKSIYQEAKEYCNNIEYSYFPNMSRKENFDCHLMIHNSVLDRVLDNPDDFIELANGYKGLFPDQMLEKRDYYKNVVCPFHNGMGMLDESVKTYGQRNTIQDSNYTILNNKAKLINRIGLEPHQWLCYYQIATSKKVGFIPTETVWLPNRENQQQDYTLMENGYKHLWGISAYTDNNNEDTKDIAKVKQSLPQQLYNTLPTKYKI